MSLADSSDQLKLIAGAAMLYAAGRVGSRQCLNSPDQSGRRAILHWAPIAALAIGAVFLHLEAVALAVVFATTVGALALVGGCVSILGMHKDEPAQWPPRARRVGSLLLPVALLAFLAGFSGRLDYFAAGILAAQGLILLIVWQNGQDGEREKGPRISVVRTIGELALCAAGAWLALQGMIGFSRDTELPPPAIVATIALCPLMVAPMLLNGSELAQNGRAWAASMTQIGVAQLNLCALLPLTAVLWRLKWHEPLYYPVANWRVDAVVIVLLSAGLLPAAAGRWRPGKLEGAALLVAYVAYILAVIFVAGRQ